MGSDKGGASVSNGCAGTIQLAAHDAVLIDRRKQHAPAAFRTGHGARSQQRVGALGAEQVGYAHAGNHVRDRVGRIGDRHAQYGGALPRVFGIQPEGRALASIAQDAFIQGNAVSEQRQLHGRRFLFGNAEIDGVGIRRTAQEIEDAVATGIESGGETGPGHRRLRWIAGCQVFVMTLLAQGGKIGQAAFLHPALAERGVKPVETNHHRA
jgi:hypothetical protein